MGFFSRLIRFVFWVVMVSWVIKLLGRILGGSRQAAQPAAGAATSGEPGLSSKRLVKDPVCGMHMAEELALPMSKNGETQYFCSPECRAKYESGVLRHVANA